MTRRFRNLYLLGAPFLAVPVGMTRDAAGTVVLLAAYAAFVALTGAVVWRAGAAKTASGVNREHPAFLAGVLLLAGPLVLLLGASVTGAPTAASPGDYVLNTTALLLGSGLLISGYVVLFVGLPGSAGRLFPMLGLAGLLIGAAVWLANLVFRYAVVASGAAGMQAGVEDRAWFAHEYLRGLAGEPSWMAFMLVWNDMLQLAFVILAYLSTAAFGAALTRAGWLGRVGGRVFVAFNLAPALATMTGIILAGYGSAVGAWTALILTIPFMVFVLPYFLGAALIRLSDGARGVEVAKRRY